MPSTTSPAACARTSPRSWRPTSTRGRTRSSGEAPRSSATSSQRTSSGSDRPGLRPPAGPAGGSSASRSARVAYPRQGGIVGSRVAVADRLDELGANLLAREPGLGMAAEGRRPGGAKRLAGGVVHDDLAAVERFRQFVANLLPGLAHDHDGLRDDALPG